MIKIKLENLVNALFFIVFIGVFAKSISIPFLNEHINKIEFLYLAFIVAVVVVSKKKLNVEYLKSSLIFYFLYLIISLLSSLKSFEFINILQLLLNSKFILSLIILSSVQSINFDKLYKLMVVLITLNVIFIFVQVISPSFYTLIMKGAITDTIIQGTNFKRFPGIFYHPAPMGAFSSCLFLISVVRFFTKKFNKYDYPVFLFSLISLISSGQRLETLSIMISLLVVYIVMKLKSNTIKLALVAIIPLLLYGLYSFQMSSIDTRFDNHSNARLVLYIGGIKLANNYFPLGKGLSSYGSSTSEISDSNAYAEVGIDSLWWFEGASYLTDTFWAMVIGESGWLGFLFYGLMIIFLIKQCFEKLIKNRFDNDKWIFMIGLAMSIYFLINSFASPVFSGATLPLLIAGLFIGHNRQDKISEK